MNDLKHSNYQRRSPEEWEVIFKNYKASNLSKTAFCKRHGIKPTTFMERYNRYQRKLDLSKAEIDAVPDFIPVTLSTETLESKINTKQELTITIGKASITLTPGFDPAFLQSVVSALASLC